MAVDDLGNIVIRLPDSAEGAYTCPICEARHNFRSTYGTCSEECEQSYKLELTKSEKPQGLKYDKGKLRYGLVPPIATKALAEVLTFGAKKYAPNSWQTVKNGQERYLDALYRHLEAYRDGEKTDPESGLSHLAHAITNIAFLLHFEKEV